MADEEKAPAEPSVAESRVLAALADLGTKFSTLDRNVSTTNNVVSSLSQMYARDKKANDARLQKIEDEIAAGVHTSSNPNDFRPPQKSLTSEVRDSIKVQSDRVDSLKDETAKQTPLIEKAVSESMKQTPMIERIGSQLDKVPTQSQTALAQFLGQVAAAAVIGVLAWLLGFFHGGPTPTPAPTSPSYSAPASPNR